MSDKSDNILRACGWYPEREAAPLIAERVANYAAARIEKLEAKIGELESAQQWISVDDRLPDIRAGWILAYWDDGDITLWRAKKLAGGKDYVTHWMPLPEPPEKPNE